MHTEKEAKKKWCPHVRATSGGGVVSYNRVEGVIMEGSTGKVQQRYACVASQCMMWKPSLKTGRSTDGKFTKGEPNGRGQCGLMK